MENWRQDFREYRSLIEERFLGGVSGSQREVVEVASAVSERVEIIDAPDLPLILASN